MQRSGKEHTRGMGRGTRGTNGHCSKNKKQQIILSKKKKKVTFENQQEILKGGALTSTVRGRRSVDFADRRERESLRDIQNDTILSTTLEGLTEALSFSAQHRLQTSTAFPLWLCCCAVV
jgi:hypothetical protein